MSNICRKCQHFSRQTESWEMPHIWWFECGARPAMANLKSFPFHSTSCAKWKAIPERKYNLSGGK